MNKFFKWLQVKSCNHRFRLGDQSLTGIPEPEKPAKNASYAVWETYWLGLEKSDWHRKRIQWPCAKCGKMFYAHCGLDILSKYGTLQKNETEKAI